MADIIESSNAIREAVLAIEKELGINPKNIYGNVRARLDILENRINNPSTPSPSVENPFIVGTSGITISAGTGEPAAAEPSGSLYLRSDGNSNEKLYVKSGTSWLLVNLLETYALSGESFGGAAIDLILPASLFVNGFCYNVTFKTLIVTIGDISSKFYSERKVFVFKDSDTLSIYDDVETIVFDSSAGWNAAASIISNQLALSIAVASPEDRRANVIVEIQKISSL